MRTLALAIAMSVCLGTSAAHALCTTGVECIRERFGADTSLRNNRIIDRTDRLGDRGRPENPYLAGQNAAGQARRAGRFDSTLGGRAGAAAAGRPAVDPLGPGEVRPDVRYTPDTAIENYTPQSRGPGEFRADTDGTDLTIAPYDPVMPATGAAGTHAEGAVRRRGTLPAVPARRDQNTPQGAANLRFQADR